MKRFIATIITILLISGAAFYLISLPHEWAPHAFRLAMLATYIGASLVMALYHLLLYVFTSRERVFLLFTGTALLTATRLATIPGSIMELVMPVDGLPYLYHISEVSIPLIYITAHQLSHEMLQIKWGGLPTRVIYIAVLGLPLVYTVITGSVTPLFLFMCGIPHAFIVCRGLESKYCRGNPYMIMYICMLAFFFVSPLLYIMPCMRELFAPAAAFWLMWILLQAALLSSGFGEIRNRELELSKEKVLLESLIHTKSEFFGNISHEMKTPLTIISTDIQLAEYYMDEGRMEEAKTLIREAWLETMQTANLVTDALAFARGQEVSKPMEPFNFGAVIEATLAVFEPFIKKQGNTLAREIAKVPPVTGNADMLASALVNLLSNANRHTKGGLIKVKWSMDAGWYHLAVCDNGAGISPEILPRVFERGVTDGNGTGLGLAIVKSVTELHGGEVTIDSAAGKGTAVMLTFPMLTEEPI